MENSQNAPIYYDESLGRSDCGNDFSNSSADAISAEWLAFIYGDAVNWRHVRLDNC